MAKPTSKGRVHDVTTRVMTQLSKQAGDQARCDRGAGMRPWNRPDDAPSTLDVAGTTKSFDRGSIDGNYREVVADPAAPGTVGDSISLKTQGDYISLVERGYRARHCTPVRLLAMAAARRKAHENPRGVLLGGMLKAVQDDLKAGQA